MAKMPSTTTQPCIVTTATSSATAAAAAASVSSRIPATLQSVFLASNRGQIVNKPPPAKVASKTYFRNWLFQGRSNSNSNSNTSKTSASSSRSLFSFKSSAATTASTTTTSSSSTSSSSTTTLPSSGMCSPPRTTSSSCSNGSKYKIIGSSAYCTSKKQTDALVHAAIAAAERLEQAQQQREEEAQQQQQQSCSARVVVVDTENKPLAAATAASSPSTLDFHAAASAVTDVSETESSDSSCTTDVVSVTATANNNTPQQQKTESTPIISVSPAQCVAAIVVISPQAYLDNLLHSRGYSIQRYQTLQTAYYNKPTPLQIASYHVHLINLARNQECHSFTALLCSGLSPNPANLHGESLLHTVCRRGLHTVLKCMLEKCHATIAVADDYGRTPLHDAMWNNTPSLNTISLLLKHGDASSLFFLEDVRGALPLQYARQEHWPIWLQYLDHVKDDYWPMRCTGEQAVQEPSLLLTSAPGSHPLVDPIHALPLDVAVLVASGKLSPAEAVFLVDEQEEEEESDDDDDESGNDDDDDDDMSQGSCDSEDDEDDDDDDSSSCSSSWDEEMDDMLQELPTTAAAKMPYA